MFYLLHISFSYIKWTYSEVFYLFRQKTPFGLLVAFNQSAEASGSLYLDDGESLGIYYNSLFTELYGNHKLIKIQVLFFGQ